MTPSYLGPCRKEVLGVSPPKRDIPGVTKHHYCLCFCCHRTLLSSIEKRKGLYPPIQFILTGVFLQFLTSPFLPARFHLFSHQLKFF